ncbi:selenocysteine-specific translation elongation factor [candidate division KSB3 bacterium]|uniref:Selenocysteine-specific elongation factor n=1 Tax=candidate division KSB3 bacterium TaxID=2044937 RepID=A0A9D5JUS0_9BACT|nr:selenocysteine-specific translation elongation factor [candidate division KSB3 bacterium]MBD3324624.1 selenocysteine-specific translation elongation factor [candidate division KSB3 bacterium]
MMKHIIVGTAGHIDHGKTALIKALTGIETDRLKEEQQRGITIDIGFAFLTLSNGIELGIIDVPGHEKFVKNMLAGVGGIDLALLVIAADEGMMPQTAEHLAICDLLQIQHGLVAVTKTDLVEDEWLEMVIEDVREGLQGTFLQDAPILPVSSKTREGLEPLIHELDRLANEVQERSIEGVFRLPIDRVFTIKGFGTVITGTLISGSVQTEETVEILPDHIKSRVRNIQVHGTAVSAAYAGQRTALNLHGIEKQAFTRGAVLCEPDLIQPTYMLDAELFLLPQAAKPLKYRSRVRLHHGTSEVLARVVLFDRDALAPGERAYVQFRLESPVTALANDRYIIRSYSPITTIGGGEILHPHPRKHKRSARILAQLDTLKTGSLEDVFAIYIEQAGFTPVTPRTLAGMVAVSEQEIRTGLHHLIERGIAIDTDGQDIAVIHATHYQQAAHHLLDILDQFHAQFPLKAGIAKEALRKKLPEDLPVVVFQRLLNEQVAAGTICVDSKTVWKSTHRLQLSAKQQRIRDALEQMYLSARFQPPNRKDALHQTRAAEKESQEMLTVLVDEGTLVRVEGEIYYHHAVLEEMTRQVVAYLKAHHTISIGDAKDLFQISRKYSVPLMTYLDAVGITMRKGDVRILRTQESDEDSHA